MSIKWLRRTIALAGFASLLTLGLSTPANAVDLGPVGSYRIVRIDPAEMLAGSALGAEIKVTSGVRDRVTPQTWNNTSGQKWKMWIDHYVEGPNNEIWPVVVFQNLRYSGICLDKSMDTATSNNVYLYPCSGTMNQEWYLRKYSDLQYSLGKFYILNSQNSQGLTSRSGVTSTSNPVNDGYHSYALYDVS